MVLVLNLQPLLQLVHDIAACASMHVKWHCMQVNCSVMVFACGLGAHVDAHGIVALVLQSIICSAEYTTVMYDSDVLEAHCYL